MSGASDVQRSYITLQHFCHSCGTLRSGSTAKLRLICHTKDDRWTMALLDPSVLASDRATLRILWVIGRAQCMQHT